VKVDLHESCVYTIALPYKLAEASKAGTPMREAKRWVTAENMVQEAKECGRAVPVLFADSRDCRRLVAWSILTAVEINKHGTQYWINQLWGVPRGARPQDVRTISTGEKIAEGHIRPYVLCETPDFIFSNAKAPRSWAGYDPVRREAQEGARRLVSHMHLERNRGLVLELKQERSRLNAGHLKCEVCTFDFMDLYGPIGEDFIEAHHISSLANAPATGQITSLDDFALVCSNCHSMLHRAPEFPTVDTLSLRVKRNRDKARKTAARDRIRKHGA